MGSLSHEYLLKLKGQVFGQARLDDNGRGALACGAGAHGGVTISITGDHHNGNIACPGITLQIA